MRPITVLLALLFTALSAVPAWSDTPDDLLDNLDEARTASDTAAFLSLLASDAVVLGMGGSGPLSGPALSSHIDALFSAGRVSDYTSVQRDIRYSPAGDVAWFNELLEGPGGIQMWESGVLIDEGGEWKVAQYTTAAVQGTVSAAPIPASAGNQQVTAQPIAPAAPAATQSTVAQPVTTEPAAAPATAEPVQEREKKRCRRMRHKTNRASNC